MKLCTVCGAKRFARKLCRMHYARLMRGLPMEPPKWASRLTREQVDDIMSSGDSLREVARRNGIGHSYAHMIRKGKRKPVAV